MKECVKCGGENISGARYCEHCGEPFGEDRASVKELFGGKYRLLEILGEGGMGRVYLAERAADKARVAIKLVHEHMLSNREVVKRFMREAKLMEEVRHPNLMPLLDRIEHDGALAIVMPFIGGGDLSDWIQDNEPTRETVEHLHESVEMVLQMLECLQELHSRGVVHRDLKPKNILISAQSRPIVCDLGIAHVGGRGTKLTKTAQGIGTALYMAPEQHKGAAASPASDVYAIGLILFEMLAGRFPFDVPDTNVLFQIATAHINGKLDMSRLPASTPVYVRKALTRALDKDPDTRFASANEFSTALLAGEGSSTRVPGWVLIASASAIFIGAMAFAFSARVDSTDAEDGSGNGLTIASEGSGGPSDAREASKSESQDTEAELSEPVGDDLVGTGPLKNIFEGDERMALVLSGDESDKPPEIKEDFVVGNNTESSGLFGGVGRGGGGISESGFGVADVGAKDWDERDGGSKPDIGEKPTRNPKLISGKPKVAGALDKKTIRRVERQHRNEIRYCYEKELQKNPKLAGTVKIKFTISGTGSVVAALVNSSTLDNSKVEHCMTSKIRRWVFPEPKDGGIVTVTYPFTFSSKKIGAQQKTTSGKIAVPNY